MLLYLNFNKRLRENLSEIGGIVGDGKWNLSANMQKINIHKCISKIKELAFFMIETQSVPFKEQNEPKYAQKYSSGPS
jgi:hypothetical protein